ncbi:DUF1961 family protein [Cyclobacterium marinum]|uniref:DUF1961 family protein n=1 Tax=Cyclobacterium marinum TaxID=104 RepID=UPI0011ECF48A|nr:DUF1961 family protein [Cyclobacterium marinum]MBI0397279.1 DUF1961 family protein [Cyclobacterium marinum]
MKFSQPSLFIIFSILSIFGCKSKETIKDSWTKSEILFEDSGIENWENKWMLDGLKAKVVNSNKGMELLAGPEQGENAHHTVLWTKPSFEGNICIEYDYTRTDTASNFVNILYFHATGKGDKDFPKDISLWNDKRKVPSMSTYFNNMNTYHISYAAFGGKEDSLENDYIRLRRYHPKMDGLTGTDVPEDYFNTGLFKPNVTYHIQVFKFDDTIEMHIQNKMDTLDLLICKWDASIFPLYNAGRIGLRHMYTRSARYKDFKVWRLL